MPNRDGFTTAHGFMRRDGKPDTANVACMKDCVRGDAALLRDARLRARPARQPRRSAARDGRDRRLTTVAAAPNSGEADCEGCGRRSISPSGSAAWPAMRSTPRLVGPAFREIAARYGRDGARPAQADAEARLAAKVKRAAPGVWGDVAMPGAASGWHGGRADDRPVDRWRSAVARAGARRGLGDDACARYAIPSLPEFPLARARDVLQLTF